LRARPFRVGRDGAGPGARDSRRSGSIDQHFGWQARKKGQRVSPKSILIAGTRRKRTSVRKAGSIPALFWRNDGNARSRQYIALVGKRWRRFARARKSARQCTAFRIRRFRVLGRRSRLKEWLRSHARPDWIAVRKREWRRDDAMVTRHALRDVEWLRCICSGRARQTLFHSADWNARRARWRSRGLGERCRLARYGELERLICALNKGEGLWRER
jgi:hypothetical protein